MLQRKEKLRGTGIMRVEEACNSREAWEGLDGKATVVTEGCMLVSYANPWGSAFQEGNGTSQVANVVGADGRILGRKEVGLLGRSL